MARNVGNADRIIRVVIGLALISLFFVLPGMWKMLGLIAIVPLATAAIGWCPLYAMFGIRTCPVTGETMRRS